VLCTQARRGWGRARNAGGGPGYTPRSSPAPLSLLRRPRGCLLRPCSKPGAPRLDGVCRIYADLSVTQCALAGQIRLAAARAVYVQVRSSPGVCTLSLTAISVMIFFSIFASYPSSPPLSHARDSPSPCSVPSQRPAHLDALRTQHPAARAMACGKLVEALAAAALFALSVDTDLAEGKSALVRPAVRRRASR
jgi:hypothetical protein